MIQKRYCEIESLLFGKVELKPSHLAPIENLSLNELLREIEEAKENASIAPSNPTGDATSLKEEPTLDKGDASVAGSSSIAEDVKSLKEEPTLDKEDANIATSNSLEDITSSEDKLEVMFAYLHALSSFLYCFECETLLLYPIHFFLKNIILLQSVLFKSEIIVNPELIAQTIAEGVRSRQTSPFNSQPSYDIEDVDTDDDVCISLIVNLIVCT